MLRTAAKVAIKKEVNLRIVEEFLYQIWIYQKCYLISVRDNMKKNLTTTKKYKKNRNRNKRK